jgi:hypothetical protein
MLFCCLIIIIAAIVEALYAAREMNVDHFSGVFSILNFRVGDDDISIKKQKTPII